MALLRAEAEKLQLPELIRGVIEEIVTTDEMTFNVVPFKNIGSALIYEYNRELSLGAQAAEYIVPETTDATGESAATFTKIQVKPTVLIAAVDVPRLYRGDPIQTATQLQKKAKQVARLFAQQMVVGSGTIPQMNSLVSVAGTGSQTFAAGASGAALSLTFLDQVCDLIPNGANALIMPSRTIRSYKALLRSAGGTDAAMMQLPNYSRPVLTYNGIPILKNDWLPLTETEGGSGAACNSIYAVRFNEDDGVCAIMSGGSVVDVTGPIAIKNSDRDNYVVTMRTNFAVHSTLSLARVRGITN